MHDLRPGGNGQEIEIELFEPKRLFMSIERLESVEPPRDFGRDRDTQTTPRLLKVFGGLY